MKWNNEVQEAVVGEWMEGCQKAKGPQALRVLRLQIGKSYGLNVSIVRGIIEAKAVEGLSKVKSEGNKTDGHAWEPINYHQLVAGQEERIRTLERKFEYLLDGIEKVLTDGETMGIHLGNLRQMGKWMKKRDALDLEEMTQAPPDENRVEIKTKPMAPVKELSPIEKIDKLRPAADSAFKRGKLLFQEIEEGKKAITDQG